MAEEIKIAGETDACLRHIGRRLGERQRQVAELVGHRIRCVAVVLPSLVEQEADGGVAIEHRHVERQRGRPVRVARGDQHPAAACLRQEAREVVGSGRVVENQQPAVPAAERLAHDSGDRREIALARLREAERLG
jgi:hypothetical protein